MTVCGEKVTGVCVAGKCPYFKRCHPIVWDKYGKIKPKTNEEWLKSLDTEGLVDYLYEVHKGGNTVERQKWIENHKERVKMQFRGWLKQPHQSVTNCNE